MTKDAAAKTATVPMAQRRRRLRRASLKRASASRVVAPVGGASVRVIDSLRRPAQNYYD
jgi:hypothetical protein